MRRPDPPKLAEATVRAGFVVRDNLRIADSRGTDDKNARMATLAASGDKMIVYVKELDAYVPDNEVPAGMTAMNISGTQLPVQALAHGAAQLRRPGADHVLVGVTRRQARQGHR